MWYFAALFAGAVLGGFIMSLLAASKTKPVPPTPKPKKFGLTALEKVKTTLGGLSSADAKVVKVAVAVGELEFTALDEIESSRADLAARTESRRKEIADLESEIVLAKMVIKTNNDRTAELVDLAGAFDD